MQEYRFQDQGIIIKIRFMVMSLKELPEYEGKKKKTIMREK